MSNTTDRELLELAAKAAGISDLCWWNEKIGYMWDGEGFNFDPLNEDGDALRLAVKLGLDISFDLETQIAYCEECMEPAQRNGGNMEKSTRLAIVRAAADIGRAMP